MDLFAKAIYITHIYDDESKYDPLVANCASLRRFLAKLWRLKRSEKSTE